MATAHLLLFRSGVLNSIVFFLCGLFFFSICLIGLLLVGFDFHFCRVFCSLVFEREKVGWVGRGKNMIKISCIKTILIKSFLKMSC